MGKTPRISVRLHRYEGRPYGLIWQCGQRSGEISSGTTNRRDAERAAGRLEEQLSQGVIPGKSEGAAITWQQFRARYEREWLETMSDGSKGGWRSAANHFERICKPVLLMDVNKSMLSKFRGELEAMGLSAVSARSYYRALHAGLGWAADVADLIDQAPTVRLRRSKAQTSVMRSRPVLAEEYERMLAVAAKVRRNDAEAFRRFMSGLWLTGLRIDELNRLRWESGTPCHVDIARKPPMIVFLGGQKSGADGYLPAPPEFWQMIGRGSRGHVFPMPGKKGEQMQTRSIGRQISEIGKAAGVIVNDKGKCASAHDLRRGYITTVAAAASMSQTQQLARHADPKTTSQFYIRHKAEELAEAMGW